MRLASFDIEADNLLRLAEKIWCIVIQDLQTNEVFSYDPDSLNLAIKKLQSYDALVAHNGVMYDKPVAERILCENIPPVFDTLLLSRLFFPDKYKKPLYGNHGLETWGDLLKLPKGNHKDFSKFTPEMLTYCVNDVAITTKLWDILKPWRTDKQWQQSILLEHRVADIVWRQTLNGIHVNKQQVESLQITAICKKEEALQKLKNIFPPKIITEELKTPSCWVDPLTKDIYRIKSDAPIKIRNRLVRGPNKIKETIEEFNPGSPSQIISRFIEKYDWKPEMLTDKGNPSTSNEALDELEFPEVDDILAYRLYSKKESQSQEWLNALVDDHKIYGNVITNGAVTGRMAHSNPNLAQIPRVGKPLGKECRQCFGPRPGWVMVGADASGLELRCLANRMWKYDNGDYGKQILEADIHTYNQKAAGLKTRDQAKTFIYAFLYGAQPPKLGRITGGTKQDGERLTQSFLEAIPAIKNLRQEIDQRVIKHQSVIGLDGRIIPIRSKHAALNSQLQGDGAVIMKQALVLFYDNAVKRFGDHGNRWALLLNVHDEFQIECEPKIAYRMGNIMVDAIRQAGVVLNMKMPLDGEFKLGRNWAETH